MTTTTAQQIADLGPDHRAEFPNARIVAAVMAAGGSRQDAWFNGHSIVFPDGSVLTMRGGQIESPRPSAIQWTTERRIEWDI